MTMAVKWCGSGWCRWPSRRRCRRPARDHVEPLRVALRAAVQRVLELPLDGPRDLAGLAGADRAAVDLSHRPQLGRRAGHEHLVVEVELAAGDLALDDLEAAVARDLDRRDTVDAAEDRRRERRRGDNPVLDEEQVLAGALADVAGLVEQDAL